MEMTAKVKLTAIDQTPIEENDVDMVSGRTCKRLPYNVSTAANDNAYDLKNIIEIASEWRPILGL